IPPLQAVDHPAGGLPGAVPHRPLPPLQQTDQDLVDALEMPDLCRGRAPVPHRFAQKFADVLESLATQRIDVGSAFLRLLDPDPLVSFVQSLPLLFGRGALPIRAIPGPTNSIVELDCVPSKQ